LETKTAPTKNQIGHLLDSGISSIGEEAEPLKIPKNKERIFFIDSPFDSPLDVSFSSPSNVKKTHKSSKSTYGTPAKMKSSQSSGSSDIPLIIRRDRELTFGPVLDSKKPKRESVSSDKENIKSDNKPKTKKKKADKDIMKTPKRKVKSSSPDLEVDSNNGNSSVKKLKRKKAPKNRDEPQSDDQDQSSDSSSLTKNEPYQVQKHAPARKSAFGRAAENNQPN